MWIFMCNLRGNNKPRRFAGKFWFCGMEKAAAPADEGARTGNEWRSASPFRRRAQDPRSSTDSQAGGFWYAVIFSASINAAVRRKCSISTQRTRAICEAVTRRVRLCSAPIKSYIKNRVYKGYMRIFIYGLMGALYYSP